jgi:hypothetical protein
VALIVGPAGSLTNVYRQLADDAAVAARAGGAEVVKVYSPDATWPAVKRAVTGASIVVYLGHGNGWPSRYRDALYPPTQNGFGLNPVSGGDDYTHQYFGEAAVGRLKFAPNAVVVLSHLCYASGNSEPGLVEGTRDQAVQRVDNYAAGFLRAGARAVVAEAYLGPAYYVRAVLRERGSVESIWRASSTFVGRHTVIAPSARTPGYSLILDPERASGGYTRSIVTHGLTAAELRSGALGTAGLVSGPVVQPSLTSAGLRFASPLLKTLPIAGTTTRLTLPLSTGRTAAIPVGAQVSVRWDPIQLDAPAAPAPTVAPAPVPTPTPVPPTPTPAPSPSALATPAPSPTIDPDVIARFEHPHASQSTPDETPAPTPSPAASTEPVAPDVALVVPEQTGTVVTPVQAVRSGRGLGIDVAYPSAPGLYRLTATLHTPEGVAYDTATQALLTPVLVRVGGSIAVAYGAPATLSVQAGGSASVAVRILNAGSTRWNAVLAGPKAPDASTPGATAAPSAIVLPQLVATWVSVSGNALPDPTTIPLPGDAWAPGGSTDVLLHVATPDQAGAYLLLIDVITPEHGPLSAQGSAPALIRVTVNGVATPAPVSSGSPPPDQS